MTNDSWGSLLSKIRKRGFIGRESELCAFEEFARHDEKRLLCFTGEVGIGKTALLRHLESNCRERGWKAHYIRGEDWPRGELPADLRQDGRAPQILFLDDFDLLVDVEAELRELEFPLFGDNVRVVMSSKHPLSFEWMGDVGWRSLISTVELSPFTVDESVCLLSTSGLAAGEAERLHEIHHGIPGLLVEASQASTGRKLGHLEQRCTHHENFASKTEETVVRPPSFSRDAFFGKSGRDLDLSAPLRHSFESTVRALESSPCELEQDQKLEQIVSLTALQDNGAYPELSRLARDYPHQSETASLVHLVSRRLGPRSSLLAEKWFKHAPGGAVVGRDETNLVKAYAHFSDPRDLPPQMVESDPALQVAYEWFDEIQLGDAPISFCRFFCPSDGDFRVDRPQMVFLMKELQRGLLLSEGAVAISVQPKWVLDELSTWGRHPVRGRFECDGTVWTVCGYDLRDKSPLDIIRGRVDRNVRRLLLVPSRPEFDRAVRDALRHFHRGDLLAASPLLDWLEISGPSADRVAALRQRIESTVAQFGDSGADAHQIQLLSATFLEESAKQRAIAAQFGMGFSTYRHHLRTAIRRLTDLLWEDAFSHEA